MNYTVFFIWSVLISIFSFVYTYILTQPDHLLNGTYKRLYSFFKTDERLAENKSVHWLFKILMYCEKCNAGQIACWLYLFNNLHNYYLHPVRTFLFHLSFITLSIFLTSIIKNTYTKHE